MNPHPNQPYPYDPRTHTFLSPAGLSYPAPHPSPGSGHAHATSIAVPPYPTGHGTRHVSHPSLAWGVPMTGQPGGSPLYTTPYSGPSDYRDHAFGRGHSQRASIAATVLRNPLAGSLSPGRDVPASRTAPHLVSPTAGLASRTPPPRDAHGFTYGEGRSQSSLSPAILSNLVGLASRSTSDLSNLRVPSPSLSIGAHSEPTPVDSSRGGQRWLSLPQRPEKPLKPRTGGPPKAVLGGPGGKTFDEMASASASASAAPSPVTRKSSDDVEQVKPGSESAKKSTVGGEAKGKIVTVRLPPERYSPPDSPAVRLPTLVERSAEDSDDAETRGEPPVHPIPPRRDAFPWPAHQIRLSATGTPLPPSPPAHDHAEDREGSLPSSYVSEATESGDSPRRAKETRVNLPDERAWERLLPPQLPDENADRTPTELETAEVFIDPNDGVDSSSFEHESGQAEPRSIETSPVPDDPLEQHADDVDVIQTETIWDSSPTVHPTSLSDLQGISASTSSPPNQPITPPPQDDVPATFQARSHTETPRDVVSPTSSGTDGVGPSPIKRSFSGLGNRGFLKRQLGGLLKDPPARLVQSQRKRHASDGDGEQSTSERATDNGTSGNGGSGNLEDGDEHFVEVPLTAPVAETTSEVDDPDKTLVDDSSHPTHVKADSKIALPHSVALDLAVETSEKMGYESAKEDQTLETSKVEQTSASRGRAQRATVGPKLGRFLQGQLQGFLRPADDRIARKASLGAEDGSVLGTKRCRDDQVAVGVSGELKGEAPIIPPQSAESVPATPKPKDLFLPQQLPKSNQPTSTGDPTLPAELASSAPLVADSPASRLHALGTDTFANELTGSPQSADLPAPQRSISSSVLGLTTFHTKLRAGAASFRPSGFGSSSTSTSSSPTKSVFAPYQHASQPSVGQTISPSGSTKPSGLRATAMDFQSSTSSQSSRTSLSSPIKPGFAQWPSGPLASTPNLDNAPHEKLRPTATSFVPTHNSRTSLASSVLEDSVLQFTQPGSGDLTFSSPRDAAVSLGFDSPQKRLRPSAMPFRPSSRRGEMSTPRTSVAEMFSSPGYGSIPRSAETASESEDGSRKRLRPTAPPFAPIFGIDLGGTTAPTSTSQSAKIAQAVASDSPKQGLRPEPRMDGSLLRPSAAAFVPSAPFTFSFGPVVPPKPANEPGSVAGHASTFLGRPAFVVEATSGSPRMPTPGGSLPPSEAVIRSEGNSIHAPTDSDRSGDNEGGQQEILVDSASDTISQGTPPTSDGINQSGLFFRSPAGTPSSISPDAGLAIAPLRGEASPRFPPGEESWKGIKEPPTKPLSTPSNRASREDRQSPKRKAENSHLPALFASIPRGPTPCEEDLAEVTIHQSRPIHSPHATLSIGASPAKQADVDLGRAYVMEPVGAVVVESTDADNDYGADSNRDVADGEVYRPDAGDVADVPVVSTTMAIPAQVDQGSSLDPLASPFSFARSIVRLSRVPDTPLITEAHFRAQEDAFQSNELDETELSPDSAQQVLATLPLATPSEGGISPVSIPVFTQPVIQVDEAADNRRFRAWVFPSGPSHSSRPSFSRRYSAPNDNVEPEDEVAEQNRPNTSLGVGVGVAVGVASTYRGSPDYTDDDGSGQQLSFEHDLEPSPAASAGAQTDYGSVQASVEFPLRQTKALAIVNDSPKMSASSIVPSAVSLTPGAGEEALELHLLAQKVDKILHVIEQTTLRAQEAEQYPQDVAERMAGKVREDIVAGQAIVFAAFRETAEADRTATLEPSLNHIASILEAHSQLLSTIQSGNELVSSEADSVYSRLQEMFASLLTGQHAMLDMFSELSETGHESRDELRGAILALRDLQTTVQLRSAEIEEAHRDRALHAAQKELEELKSILREARTEGEVLTQRLADVRAERDELRVGLEDRARRLEEREHRGRDATEKADRLEAMKMAAEGERDALAVALHRASSQVDTQEEELKVLRSELESEREKAAAIPVVDVHAERLAEMELSSKTFQEELLQRLGRLDESMHESMGLRVKEYESVLDRNRLLHGELDSLRQKLDATTEKFQTLQLSTTTTLASSEREQATLAEQLSAERARREAADRRIQELERSLAKVSEEKVDWQMIATERQAAARMSEMRVHALSQENVYWRQFALSYDRKQFSRFMSANPGLAAGGTNGKDAPEASSKEAGLMPAGSSTPGMSKGPDGGGTVNGLEKKDAEEGGAWWNVAK